MEITWDSVKAKSNRLKHRVFFSDVEPVFHDPHTISLEDPDSEGEARHIAIGRDAVGRVVVVIYTYRDSVIRLISARQASKTERYMYEKGIRL
jgi:hypothetical protein